MAKRGGAGDGLMAAAIVACAGGGGEVSGLMPIFPVINGVPNRPDSSLAARVELRVSLRMPSLPFPFPTGEAIFRCLKSICVAAGEAFKFPAGDFALIDFAFVAFGISQQSCFRSSGRGGSIRIRPRGESNSAPAHAPSVSQSVSQSGIPRHFRRGLEMPGESNYL